MKIDDAELRRCLAFLELSPGATFDEVRAAYRTLTQVWHPDRFVGQPTLQETAERRQQELNAAYRVLVRHYQRAGAAAGGSGTEARAGRQRRQAAGKPGSAVVASGSGGADPHQTGAGAQHGAGHDRRHPGAETAVPAEPASRRIVYAAAVVLGLVAAGLAARSHTASETVALDGAPVRAAALASGGAFSCAAAGERIVCWRHAPFALTDVPAAIVALDDSVQSVAVGLSHACALMRAGDVHCWGGNFTGALGDQSLDDRRRPVPVGFDGAFTAVSALGQHTCALGTDGAAYCWGSDADGQLGVGAPVARCDVDGDRFFCSDRPEHVAGSRGWRAIAAGGSHSCAVDHTGAVRCWGSNRYGQVGTESTETCEAPGAARPCVRAPTVVDGLPTAATAVAAGASHSCALGRDGQAWCWGLNDHGQTGGRRLAAATAPAPVSKDVRFRTLAAGGDHTCAIGIDDALFCWGSDARGALRGVAPDRCDGVPCARTPIRLARSVTAVATGFGVTCIQRSNGFVRCWGEGDAVLALGADGLADGARSLEGAGAVVARVRWRLDAARRLLYRTLVMPLEAP
jgi:alpha-tubulin suppressor-like RCC1 family protein